MISIVIATKDRAPYLSRALESLAEQSQAPPFETIIVDNGSTDATPAVAVQSPVPVVYVEEPRPNRGAARNRGVARARGELILFIDDDVRLPPQFLAAHAAAHEPGRSFAVSGPIINVPSYESRPAPTAANFSRAFFCTCNVSFPRAAFEAAGGFDESFELYGWEDTELGLRLRAGGMERHFAWEAYLWHIKPPHADPLENALRRTLEKARMAARLVRKDGSTRVRLATGAYPANVARARLLSPPWSLPVYASLTREGVPAPLARWARAMLLDGLYIDELCRALEEDGGRGAKSSGPSEES